MPRLRTMALDWLLIPDVSAFNHATSAFPLDECLGTYRTYI